MSELSISGIIDFVGLEGLNDFVCVEHRKVGVWRHFKLPRTEVQWLPTHETNWGLTSP